MSHSMKPQPFEFLLSWIINEYQKNKSIFGIPDSLFYRPDQNMPYAKNLFGHHLANPIGPAAGPHTQLAQNIISAWLSGGRFIELKTVQVMDELEIPRPCIDMEDEGYNVEWSQELKLEQSADEYIKAWALIYVLHKMLKFTPLSVGTIFNISLGYNLEGIQSPSITRFINRLTDASEELEKIQKTLKTKFSEFTDLEIPIQITNNVTLSTMHGCPPAEIQGIARFLLEKKKLNTTVKLNPTLLGKEKVVNILHHRLGFHEINIPDQVFENDIKYEDAVAMIKRLKRTAQEQNLTFGVKLSNTLALENHKKLLSGNEMYMSGRALYPITMNLFHKLSQEFKGDLMVSYSAGADALNVTDILAAGARTVTVASDLLKPGGYSRLGQYLNVLEKEMKNRDAADLEELSRDKLRALEQEALNSLTNPRYQKLYHPHGLPKVSLKLNIFDCVTAPCMAQCAVCQDVPEYARLIAKGEFNRALEFILNKNPLPGITGYMCTHLCQTKCTRNNYDQSVNIRALKRFASEKGKVTISPKTKNSKKVAIIGSGPSGLAAAYFLASNGIDVTIFEAKELAGGMPSLAPSFRIPQSVIREDINRITKMGVQIKLSHPITQPPEELLKNGFDAVYIASGFPGDSQLNIDGMEGIGVYTALQFLEQVSQGEKPNLGSKVLVIGGGNTAIDAARTAQRLTGKPVTLIYRRTAHEMPAADEEKRALFGEGNILAELLSPTRVILKDEKVFALECIKNRLSAKGADGRKNPAPISGSEFQIPADTIIVAVGQTPMLPFLDGSIVTRSENGSIIIDSESSRTGTSPIFAGGDVVRGPAIIIQACADGRRTAESICQLFRIPFTQLTPDLPKLSAQEILEIKSLRARIDPQNEPKLLPIEKRINFDLVEQTYTKEEAQREGNRCLQCAEFCDKCVEVCPNRANFTYLITPDTITLPLLSCQNGQLSIAGEELFQVEQNRQIIHLDDFCNECGNCATFCVHPGKPFQDKPRLFLKEADFMKEESNAFYIESNYIRRREQGEEWKLTLDHNTWHLENSKVSIRLSDNFKIQKMTLQKPFEEIYSLKIGAEMAVILKGVTASLPHIFQA